MKNFFFFCKYVKGNRENANKKENQKWHKDNKVLLADTDKIEKT